MTAVFGFDWSDVPAWLAVVGGLVAGLVAAGSFAASRRDAQRSLASNVFLTPGPFVLSSSDSEVTLTIENRGSAPILGIVLVAFGWGKRRRWWMLRNRANWWTRPPVVSRLVLQIGPESTSEAVTVPLPALEAGTSPLRFLPIVLTFSDGAGRHWVRWPGGKLSRSWRNRRPTTGVEA